MTKIHIESPADGDAEECSEDESVQYSLTGLEVKSTEHKHWVRQQVLDRFPVIDIGVDPDHVDITDVRDAFTRLKRYAWFRDDVFSVRVSDLPACVIEHVEKHENESVDLTADDERDQEWCEYEVTVVAVRRARIRVRVRARKSNDTNDEWCVLYDTVPERRAENDTMMKRLLECQYERN